MCNNGAYFAYIKLPLSKDDFISQYLKKLYLFDRYSHNSFSNRVECLHFMAVVTTICGNLLVFMSCCRKWWLKLVKFKKIKLTFNSTDYVILWQLYAFNCWIQSRRSRPLGWDRLNLTLHNIWSKFLVIISTKHVPKMVYKNIMGHQNISYLWVLSSALKAKKTERFLPFHSLFANSHLINITHTWLGKHTSIYKSLLTYLH